METKSFRLELKSLDDTLGTFEGYAAIFNNVDAAGDIIEKGAFKKTLKENPSIPILWQHDSSQPIGVTTSAKEDDTGLLVQGTLNLDVQQGREAYALIKQGALTGLSIGYTTIKDLWDQGARRLKEIKLYEWSPVTFPCNELAGITGVKRLPELEDVIERLTKAASDRPEITQAAINSINALMAEEPGTPTPEAHEPQQVVKSDEFVHLLASITAINNRIGVT